MFLIFFIYVYVCMHTAPVIHRSEKSKRKRLSRQLTLTQKNLLRWTLSEYKEEANDRLQKYKKGSQIKKFCTNVCMYVPRLPFYLLRCKHPSVMECIDLTYVCMCAVRVE